MPVRESVDIAFRGEASGFLRTANQVRAELARLERDINRLERINTRQASRQSNVGAELAEVQRLQAQQIRSNATQQLEAQRQVAQVRTQTAQQLAAQREAGRQRTQLNQQQLEAQRQTNRQASETLRQSGREREALSRQQLETQRQTGRESLLVNRASFNEQLEAQRQAGRQRLLGDQQHSRQQLEILRQTGRETQLINRASLNELAETQRQQGRQRLQRQQQSGRLQLENLRQQGRQRDALSRQELEAERRREAQRLETQRTQGRRSLELQRHQGRLELAEFRRNERLAREASRSTRGQSLFSRAGSFIGPIIPLASIYGLIDLTRRLTRASDAWLLLTNRVRLYTDTIGETQRVQQALLDVSQETRQDLSSTAQVYQRIAAANDNLGLSQERILGIVRTLNQAVAVSGVSAESASSALVQFGQALASSELRGQELRSVLEQLPRLAQLISQDLGVTRGELLALGAAGELTADRIIVALERQAGTLEGEFNRLVPTIDQGVTVATNALTQFIGILSETTGAGEGISGTFIRLGRDIEGLTERLRAFNEERERLRGQSSQAEPELVPLAPTLTGGIRTEEELERVRQAAQTARVELLNRFLPALEAVRRGLNTPLLAGEAIIFDGLIAAAEATRREIEASLQAPLAIEIMAIQSVSGGGLGTSEDVLQAEVDAINRAAEARRRAAEEAAQAAADTQRLRQQQLLRQRSFAGEEEGIAQQQIDLQRELDAVIAETAERERAQREARREAQELLRNLLEDERALIEELQRGYITLDQARQSETFGQLDTETIAGFQRREIEAQLEGIRGLREELERLRPEQVEQVDAALRGLGQARIDELNIEQLRQELEQLSPQHVEELDAALRELGQARITELGVGELQQQLDQLNPAQVGQVDAALRELGQAPIDQLDVGQLRRELAQLDPEQAIRLDAAIRSLGQARVGQLVQELQQAQETQRRWAQTGLEGIQQMRDSLFDLISGTRELDEVFRQLLENLARSAFGSVFDQLTADLTASLQQAATGQGQSGQASSLISQLLGVGANAAVRGATGQAITPAAPVAAAPQPAGKRSAPLIEQHVTLVGNPNPADARRAVAQGGRDLVQEVIGTAGGREQLVQAIEEEQED